MRLVVPADAGTQGQATEMLGSRFRGNDGYAHEAARFLAREGDEYHSSDQMRAYPSAKAGVQSRRLKSLDSRLRGNDDWGDQWAFSRAAKNWHQPCGKIGPCTILHLSGSVNCRQIRQRCGPFGNLW